MCYFFSCESRKVEFRAKKLDYLHKKSYFCSIIDMYCVF